MNNKNNRIYPIYKISFLFLFIFMLFIPVNSVQAKTIIQSGEILSHDFTYFNMPYTGVACIELKIRLSGKSGSFGPDETLNVELSEFRGDGRTISDDTIDISGCVPGETYDVYFFSDYVIDPGEYYYYINPSSYYDIVGSYNISYYPGFAQSLLCESSVDMKAGTRKDISISTIPYGTMMYIESITSSVKSVASIEDVMQDSICVVAHKAGKTTINVRLKNGQMKNITINVTNPPPKLEYSKCTMVRGGGTIKNKLKFASGKVTWSSSNKKVASVNSSGTIKAKGLGSCTITAKNKGKKYKCKVSVVRGKPDFYACISDYDTRNNRFEVCIYNYTKLPLTIMSSGAKAYEEHYKSYDRNLKLKNNRNIVVKPGKNTHFYFYVKGRVTWYDYSHFKINYKFKYDGKTYAARVYPEESQYKSGSKWKKTYSDSRWYSAWLF